MPRFIDLFAGAGGLSEGFIRAGFTPVAHIEMDKYACDTLRTRAAFHYLKDNGQLDVYENYLRNKKEKEDGSKLWSQVPENIINSVIHAEIGEKTIDDIFDKVDNLKQEEAIDLIIGGPPCQSWSEAGSLRGIEDSRGKLFYEYIRILKSKQPKFFLAENVKGLTNLAKGKVFEMILSDFSQLGYKVKAQILNAADYGVPQTRQRVIIVGVRNDVDFEYSYPLPTHQKDGENGLEKWVSVTKALSVLPDPDQPNNIPNHEYSKYKLEFNGYLGHRPLDPDKPAPTVTARGDNKGGVVILPHPNGQRRMSCRELASVQSFPIDYEFSGNRSSVYRQIGNAVPPLLGYVIANAFNEYKEV